MSDYTYIRIIIVISTCFNAFLNSVTETVVVYNIYDLRNTILNITKRIVWVIISLDTNIALTGSK